MSVKIERMNDLFQEEISSILMNEVKDKNIRFVTITGVSITSDLSFAKVYFDLLNKEYLKVTEEALNRASSFIRGRLSERIEIRHTPELEFIYDESIEYGEKIENIIKEIKNEES